MAKKDKPDRNERRAAKKTEKALSGNSFSCEECPQSFGTAEMLGLHKLLAH